MSLIISSLMKFNGQATENFFWFILPIFCCYLGDFFSVHRHSATDHNKLGIPCRFHSVLITPMTTLISESCFHPSGISHCEMAWDSRNNRSQWHICKQFVSFHHDSPRRNKINSQCERLPSLLKQWYCWTWRGILFCGDRWFSRDRACWLVCLWISYH